MSTQLQATHLLVSLNTNYMDTCFEQNLKMTQICPKHVAMQYIKIF
jgi:hypothetical protein